jgi:hypothetical protein
LNFVQIFLKKWDQMESQNLRYSPSISNEAMPGGVYMGAVLQKAGTFCPCMCMKQALQGSTVEGQTNKLGAFSSIVHAVPATHAVLQGKLRISNYSPHGGTVLFS